MLGQVSLTGYIVAKAYGGECHYNKVDGFQLAPALHVGEHEGRSEDKEQAANQQEEHCRQTSHQPRWHMPLLWGRMVDRAIEMPVTHNSILSSHPTPHHPGIACERLLLSRSAHSFARDLGKKTLGGEQCSSPRRLLRCGRCPGAEKNPAGPRLPPAASRIAGFPPVHRRYKRDARHLCVRLYCHSLDGEGSAESLGATWYPLPLPVPSPTGKLLAPCLPPHAPSPPPPMVVMMVPEKKKALPRFQADEWLLLLVQLVSGSAPPPRASATSCRIRRTRRNLSPSLQLG